MNIIHKPWPKCPTCNRFMMLKRQAVLLEEIVSAKLSAFVCEKCPKESERSSPVLPTNVS